MDQLGRDRRLRRPGPARPARRPGSSPSVVEASRGRKRHPTHLLPGRRRRRRRPPVNTRIRVRRTSSVSCAEATPASCAWKDSSAWTTRRTAATPSAAVATALACVRSPRPVRLQCRPAKRAARSPAPRGRCAATQAAGCARPRAAFVLSSSARVDSGSVRGGSSACLAHRARTVLRHHAPALPPRIGSTLTRSGGRRPPRARSRW